MKLKLRIITPEGTYLNKEVDLVNVFTGAGNLTILANHIPLISNIEISHLYYKNENEIEYYAIAGGTLFVDEQECKIVTNAIESKTEIDKNRALNAKKRAEEHLEAKDASTDLLRAEIALKKALNRISLYDL